MMDQVRGSRQERGYDAEWERKSSAVVANQPWCTYCHTTGSASNPLGADHIIPRSRGGTDDWSNLCTACRVCNSAKCDRDLESIRTRIRPIQGSDSQR
jgi:5-methylcytosine-specific restriction protein A